MTKSLSYNVDISLLMHGEVQESSCECFAGQSITACCKHMIATLFAIKDHYESKPIITSRVCTDTLQIWHHPSKRHHGSPIKARDMVNKKSKMQSSLECSATNLRDINSVQNFSETNVIEKSAILVNISDNKNSFHQNYKDYFYNVIKSRCFNSNMAIKQLMEPANPFAVENDHNYCRDSFQNLILKHFNLIDASDDIVATVEEKTIDQNKSKYWYECRKVRVTASRFYACSKDLNDKQGKKWQNQS